MIILHQHRLAFFHNPKAGGTSVRAALERFEGAEGFWGEGRSPSGARIDLAHLGIDEFAALYPETWERMRGYDLFCLYRDPVKRFRSSVAEYSRHHGGTDLRFAGPAAARRLLFGLIDRFDGLGRAEALIDRYEFRHFRPQWIYWRGAQPGLRVIAEPIERIDRLYGRIAERTGMPLMVETRNSQARFRMGGPFAALAGNRRLRALGQVLPGYELLKARLKARYRVRDSEDVFGLTEADRARLRDFVHRFYALDLARWPEPAAERAPLQQPARPLAGVVSAPAGEPAHG